MVATVASTTPRALAQNGRKREDFVSEGLRRFFEDALWAVLGDA